MNPQEVLEYAQKNEARQFDLRFTDIPSLQHHISYPLGELSESSFEEGFGMDGSSIRGWALSRRLSLTTNRRTTTFVCRKRHVRTSA